ncbi:MAG: gamma-glutamyl-gamma-aminobutyrate hydrolase family protein [SAR202 cluster bacterium]|nr:gamma-glutamyl-gamma-aminobutyrate hydrolase family protein [SAR202 cluster bacterium]
MPVVAITSVDQRNARRYIQVMEAAGATVRLLTPGMAGTPQELLQGVGGLLLSGGPDVDPALYGEAPDPAAGLHTCRPLDGLELAALRYALDKDLPVLGICRGMQLMNVAFGGKLIQDLPGHREEKQGDKLVSQKHSIFLSPGSKAAAIIGSAGFFRVNSRHHQGLKEPQRAPRLMSTAYSVEDGYIEGLESVEHSWVIGLQCHPERQEEVPRSFANLFLALKERAEGVR